MWNQIEIDIIFKNCYRKIRESVTFDEFEQFTNLCDNVTRFKYVYEKNFKDQMPLEFDTSTKDLQRALNYKNDGNKKFSEKLDREALDYYNKALLAIPPQCAREKALIRANRSAVLHHLNQYRLALLDINGALESDYPKELHYKLQERKAKCYLALKLNAEALEAFKLTLSALSDSNLPIERRKQMEINSQVMISMLGKDKKVPAKTKSNFTLEVTKTRNEYLPVVTGLVNSDHPSASHLVKIEYSEMHGRYAVASDNINVGDILVVEKASCSVLLSNLCQTYCQHCFIKVKAPIPCDRCEKVVFCSELCKKEANVYHQYECGILFPIWNAGVSVICLMALRYITQKSDEFFKKRLQAKTPSNKGNTIYDRVLSLVCHSDRRTTEDFFHRSLMACFLLYNLEQTDYFKNSDLDLKYYIGGLIIQHLELLQFNAHEISELRMHPKFPNRPDLARSEFLGGGVYQTLALFNHSCDPGVVRYFHGTSVITRAAKNIRRGEMIAENYGPIYTETPLAARKAILEQQYWFDCNCTPCIQDWPLFDKMDSTILRFRCKADRPCPNIIPVNVNTTNIFVRCGLCDQNTNIVKGLRALQETDELYQKASKLLEEGKSGQALIIFEETLKILDNTLAPPFKDYCLCQQGIRRCMLDSGNKTLL